MRPTTSTGTSTRAAPEVSPSAQVSNSPLRNVRQGRREFKRKRTSVLEEIKFDEEQLNEPIIKYLTLQRPEDFNQNLRSLLTRVNLSNVTLRQIIRFKHNEILICFIQEGGGYKTGNMCGFKTGIMCGYKTNHSKSRIFFRILAKNSSFRSLNKTNHSEK